MLLFEAHGFVAWVASEAPDIFSLAKPNWRLVGSRGRVSICRRLMLLRELGYSDGRSGSAVT